eukprot:608336-Amorphochlora_amoeboformis.AAC.1
MARVRDPLVCLGAAIRFIDRTSVLACWTNAAPVGAYVLGLSLEEVTVLPWLLAPVGIVVTLFGALESTAVAVRVLSRVARSFASKLLVGQVESLVAQRPGALNVVQVILMQAVLNEVVGAIDVLFVQLLGCEPILRTAVRVWNLVCALSASPHKFARGPCRPVVTNARCRRVLVILTRVVALIRIRVPVAEAYKYYFD